MAFCTNCGASVPENAVFCPNCGAEMKKPTTPIQPAASEPTKAETNPKAETNSGAASFEAQTDFNQNTTNTTNPSGAPQGFPGGQQGFQSGPAFQNGQGQGGYAPYQNGPQNPYPPMPPVYASNDHTADFDQEDISKNKVTAMAAYLLGTLGIIISLLAASDSPYASFHSRQALKLEIVAVLLGICSLVLCWTIVVPIAGFICMAIVFVVRIICFFQVCSGKAKDAAIIGSLPFLK